LFTQAGGPLVGCPRLLIQYNGIYCSYIWRPFLDATRCAVLTLNLLAPTTVGARINP